MWFDAFELARVDEPHEAAGEPLLHIPRDPTVAVDSGRKRQCPRCPGIKLKRHFFSARRQVQVDHCPNCGGYWLDAGELAQIRAEKAAAAEQNRAEGVSLQTVRYLYRLHLASQGRRRST